MAMYLNEVPVYTIMLIGRWSSDAFLRYIRRQVQQFSAGVSARMIRTVDPYPKWSRPILVPIPSGPDPFRSRSLTL